MAAQQNKFGTLKGVFVPSILTILGVILFLRLGWVVGQAGLVATLFIITLSSTITLLTGLSISSTATNTKLGAGGSYFLISRCFGIEPGAAVGVPLYIAQALGITFYVVGFAESLQLLFPELPVTLVAFGTLTVLTAVTFFSSDLALKMQMFILGAIVLALISFFLGSPYEPSTADPSEIVKGFGFWAIFAVFFPAVTGIEAGVSMSGDLEDPRKSLPYGTLGAVLVGYVVYILSAIMMARFAETDALISNSMIMTNVALIPGLIYLGLWGATISSAMGALLGAPRTMQALAKDRILPRFLAKGTKEGNDPQRATLVSFVIACFGLLLGDLNAIAEVLSMFFLTSYGALNLVAGLEGMIDNPSWRPTFRISWALSFVGAFLCFGAMFMINSGASFVALGLVVLIYFVMRKRNVKSNYSDIRSGLISYFARSFIYKLDRLPNDARNWRPNFLILSGSPTSRFHLIDLAYSISHKRGFMTIASIITDPTVDFLKIENMQQTVRSFLDKKNIRALIKFTRSYKLSEGAKGLIETYGIGSVSPNTIVLGDTAHEDRTDDFIKIIETAYLAEKNVIIIKDSPATQKSTDKGGSSIDVWWRGTKGNVNLMLTLAYMLKTSGKWMSAQLTLKSISESLEAKSGVEKSLSEFLQKSRVPANQNVYVRGETETFELMEKSSAQSDIVFMGIKPPTKDEDFKAYYLDLMEKTKNFKTVIFVLEAEKISFLDIFK
jgi:amino acid transporter